LSRKATIIICTCFALLSLTGIVAVVYLDNLLHLDTYKEQIIAEMETSLARKVSYLKGDFSLRYGPSLTFSNVVVKEKDGVTDFITSKSITFRIAIFPLLKKRMVLQKMLLDHPVINLSRGTDGVFNIDDLMQDKKENVPLQIKGVQVKKGIIRFSDQGVAPETITTSLEETDISLNHLTRGKTCNFKINSRISSNASQAAISLEGDVKLAGKSESLKASMINAKIHLSGLNAGHFWPYYGKNVPFRKLLGQIDLDATCKGKLAEFKSKGNLKISTLVFDYPKVFRAPLTPRNVKLSYDLDRSPNEIAFKSVILDVDGVTVKGSCAIKDINSGDPRIVAKATTNRIHFEDFYGYVPYGIIVKDPAEFIEQHIKGGNYWLEEGRLDGRISQILHMEKGDNYNVLYINARVENGILSYGPDVPTFNSIKGKLEMRGKDFNLHQMSGRFGTSPMTMEGKITDYPLNVPSAYPFTMSMTPRQPEAAWLFGKENGAKLALEGESTLRLTGSGFTSGYKLAGEWNLTPLAYSFSDLISKPAGKSNSLNFTGSINKQGAKISDGNFQLQALAVKVVADYRFSGKTPLQLDVRTNQFQIGEVYQSIPLFRKYQPSGKVQGNFRGKGDLMYFSEVDWGGDLYLSGLAFKPVDTVKYISGVNGAVKFQGEAVETSQLAAKLGNSQVFVKGSMNGFSNPALNITFTSPSLDLTDIGFRTGAKPVRIEKLNGVVALKDSNLQIKSMTGQLHDSKLNIKGSVTDIQNPRIDIAVTSSYLDIKDILLLGEVEREGKQSGGMALVASIQASTGKIGDIPYRNLKTSANYDDRILYLPQFQFSAFDGNVSGKVRVDLGANGSPRYQLTGNLDKISADKFSRAIGVKKQEITGTLTLSGDLTAKGHNSEEIKKTLLGSVKVRIERGTLRRFSVLSKIFSILNVSQLLKFQLPNMVSGGMPYNKITGSIGIRDGIASSTDLFLDSDAINISFVGKLDLPKDELDMTLGVQPLQTVDKVVSKIPVVGWILTGKDKTLITTYFEAKGKIEDPVVTAVPVKSLAKGVFNIFMRVFELPGKLITDTGEVIIGR
jgi:uncharacterized protein involved in outer membrane biogenesis